MLKNSKAIFTSIFMVLTILAFTVRPALADKDSISNKYRDDQLAEELIGMFHRAKSPRDGYTVISQDVEEFILECCKEKGLAINLLKEAGFRIDHVIDRDRVKNMNSQSENTIERLPPGVQESYIGDEFVLGRRSSGWARFWKFSTSYRIKLTIRNDEVSRVGASVYHQYPFP